MPKSAKKAKRRKLSSQEKLQRKHTREVRKVFTQSGFSRAPDICGKQITFKGTPCDIDDAFIYENIIVLCEATTGAEVAKHLKHKKLFFDAITDNPAEFIDHLNKNFPTFNESVGKHYHKTDFKIRVVYCPYSAINEELKKQVPCVYYLDYPILRYFLGVVSAIRRSAKHELLSFMDLKAQDLRGAPAGQASEQYDGFVLPESYSNFSEGHKIVAFYVDPASILFRAYVLRKDSWRNQGLYQRMISKPKVESIRKYLREQKRVFINNIVVTLPSETSVFTQNGQQLSIDSIDKTSRVKMSIPKEFGSVGIIDGQHRIFSYHEGGPFDSEIKPLRERQNLLVTGIIYPKDFPEPKKQKFEAGLFLEINSNQTNAKSGLKQEINLLLNPFDTASIAKKVINKLNDRGALSGQLERYFFDTNKLRTTSIVSYGLKPLVKTSGDDSIYSTWTHQEKTRLEDKSDYDLLEAYIDYCAKQIDVFLSAVRENLSNERWTPDRKAPGRLLTTTVINGLLICLRNILREHGALHRTDYKDATVQIESFRFSDYKSSQYAKMGGDLYRKYFVT